MKKTIAWIGGIALLTAAGTVALLADAGAEVGDQIYVHASDLMVIDYAQKLKLKDAVIAQWPQAEGHTDVITEHYCMRECNDLVEGVECEILCEVCWGARQPRGEYLALKNAGKVRKRTSDENDPVDFERCTLRTAADLNTLALLEVYVASLDASFNLWTSIDLRSKREDGEIVVRYHDIRVIAPDGYMTIERAQWDDGTKKLNRHLGAVVEE